jgi:hypothetical protein
MAGWYRMAQNYVELTAEEMKDLPRTKQAEVYDFVQFLKARKTKGRRGTRRSNSALLNLIGMGRSDSTDVSVNHDKYLYD